MKNKKEYNDEQERKAHELVKSLTRKNYKKNAAILMEAAHQLSKSKNPEAQETYNFLVGMSKIQEAKLEKNTQRKIELYDVGLEYYGKADLNDDGVRNEYIATKIKRLRIELETVMNKKDFIRSNELLFEIAKEEKSRGNEEGYYINMGLYHLYSATKDLTNNPAKALKEIDLSKQSFQKIDDNEFKSKVLGIKYRILATFQATYKARLEQTTR